MFQIGDKVLYPVHGAGIIEDIKEKEVNGQHESLYLLYIPSGDMRLTVPEERMRSLGIRPLVDDETVNRVLEVLGQDESQMTEKWSRRYRLHMEKIKSGNIFELAEVVRNLSLRDLSGNLSGGERRLLDQARDVLVSELAMVKKMPQEEAGRQLEKIFRKKAL